MVPRICKVDMSAQPTLPDAELHTANALNAIEGKEENGKLTWTHMARAAPQNGEVEMEVKYVSVDSGASATVSAGVVLQVGPGVTEFKDGDLVVCVAQERKLLSRI